MIFLSMVLYEHEIQLDYEVLCNEEIILAVPKSHRLAYLAANKPVENRPIIDLSFFKDDPFVLMKQGTKNRQIADNIFKDAGIKSNVILEVCSINTVQKTAAKGAALTLLPEKMINYSAVGDNLVYFSINPNKYYWPIIIAYRKGSYPTRATKEFISMIRSYLESIPYPLDNEESS